ncbi:MAG: FprA family A-type flavoprotein [Bacillota bacterium]
MNKVQLAKDIYYVGAVDWNLRDFHGYTTPRGVTYNSYLIVDEKICLIDTVKAPFAGELLERISQIIDPAKIDYVVTNHIEPDHSSSLPMIMARAPQAKVILTEHGRTGILKHYQQNYDFQVVKEGDILDLGKRQLKFIPLPMLHWPDSMASYMPEEQLLFSNDAFGQHICTTKRFDDENDLSDLIYEAEKYYANIIMPFGKIVVKALEKCRSIPLKMIAPSHGVVWRSHIQDIFTKYDQWANGINDPKVVIAYDSMWGSTEQMARRILDGVAASGATGRLYKMSTSERSEVVRDILTCAGLLIGSPTLQNGMMPTMGALLTYLKGLRPANKLGAAFGAYGWGGGAQTALEEMMKSAGIKLEEPGLTLKWVPDKAELDQCFAFGLAFGQRTLASLREK